MSVSTFARPSPPEDFLLLVNGLACARELTALSEAAQTWDTLNRVTGPSAPAAHEVPALILELQEVLHTLGRCGSRLRAIHRKAVESGRANETAMDDVLLRAHRLLHIQAPARTELGYLRLLAACAEEIFDLVGDTP
ncbi:hypothetical protein ACIBEA_06595 [Streptomyces sp. NPDC051555]|uniref:hypothetical protein n=1 Tax=Streptomyces sp. NPDC051555 TaxID=3365657 RepID=UPI0037915DF9